ncbi:MAG: hypothetical protein P8Z79_22440 [Sedimentisphaerales bacterium]|jgi:hypothetical protein
MARRQADNPCRRIRAKLYAAANRHFGPEAGWLRGHVASCPRCQRRLASSGRVHLALSSVKTQPHRLDLLMRANQQAISVLKHSLREEPKAQRLKARLPEPKPFEKVAKYGFSVGSVAACIAILILMKIGVFSSVDSVETRGRKVIRQYYVKHVGQDLADEVFPAEAKPPASAHPGGATTV